MAERPVAIQWRGRATCKAIAQQHPSTTRGEHMNWDRIAGNWKQAKGKMKEQWGKLTDDQLDQVAGKRDQLVGRIQESYGIGKDEAERQVSDWEAHQRDMD
jgi:uncharacterized protein YjbJ (UPF0337 family)